MSHKFISHNFLWLPTGGIKKIVWILLSITALVILLFHLFNLLKQFAEFQTTTEVTVISSYGEKFPGKLISINQSIDSSIPWSIDQPISRSIDQSINDQEKKGAINHSIKEGCNQSIYQSINSSINPMYCNTYTPI